MEIPTLECKTIKRRDAIREFNKALTAGGAKNGTLSLNGLDFVEISDSQKTLKVTLMQKATKALREKLDSRKNPLAKNHIEIIGGRRIPVVEVANVEIPASKGKTKDDVLKITLKQPGDFSIYTLRVVEIDAGGRSTGKRLAGFDPRYAQVPVNFKDNCPTDLDCKTPKICPPLEREQPEINYLAKDYATFRQLILDRLAQIMPDWKERHVPDIGVTLVELLAWAGDYLSYFQDAVATEAYLDTARQRISVRRHARLVDYPMHEGANARAWITVEAEIDESFDPADIYFTTKLPEVEKDGKVLNSLDLSKISLKDYAVFEPLVKLPHEKIHLRLTDVLEPASLAAKIKKADDPLSAFLKQQFPGASLILLDAFVEGTEPSALLQSAIVTVLNKVIDGENIYDGDRFAGVTLTTEILRLLNSPPGTIGRARLNRILLEKAYPYEIKRTQMLCFYPGHNEIEFYTWDDVECCLPKGATSATLKDAWLSGKRVLNLQVGSILVFEEIKGAKNGEPEDADPDRRHAVRLTKVTPAIDPLHDQPIVEIEWAEEDALPFALCISALGPAPDCKMIYKISVARGNVVLADHGRRVEEDLGRVPPRESALKCVKEGQYSEAVLTPAPLQPVLQQAPLTYSVPLLCGIPASKMLPQDPAGTLARIEVACNCILPGGEEKLESWILKRDLLRSGRRDRHFVAETDNDGRAHLRFGDGESGEQPAVGDSFLATYRVGNGPAGNIGAETLCHIVLRTRDFTGSDLLPRNPFPARGGVNPELTSEVKMFAPTAFRKRLERAITEEDYAELAARHEKVQRASATLQWNGSWYEMLVAIDPFGKNEADAALLGEVEAYLQRFRRMGHDVVVEGAQFVALEIVMEICVLPSYLRGHVKAEMLRIFSNKKLPDGALGFFHPDRLSFGQAIRLSNLMATAQAVQGVESVVVKTFKRLFEAPNNELENGVLPLSPLEIARLDNDPSFPENGGIEFIMRGGR